VLGGLVATEHRTMNSLPALQDRINKLAESTNDSLRTRSGGTSNSDLEDRRNKTNKVADSTNASTRTLVRGTPLHDDDRFGLVRKGARNNDPVTEIAVKVSDEILQEPKTDPDLKQQRLQHFHDLNQQFLLATQQEGRQRQQIQQKQIQHPQSQQKQITLQHEQSQEKQCNHDEEKKHLHQKIDALQELVQHLSQELRTTQDAHQLNKDQSRSEIELLRSELDRHSSRHDQIVASFRKRLVESETARMKMQDQLSSHMEKDAQREEDLKDRWKHMTTRVLEDTKWVDEQMDYWKESMEEYRKRLGQAKLRGKMDAELEGKGRSTCPWPDNGGGKQTVARGNSHEISNSNSKSASDNEILSQRRRRMWGGRGGGRGDGRSDDDDDDTDEEEMRMYGQILN